VSKQNDDNGEFSIAGFVTG